MPLLLDRPSRVDLADLNRAAAAAAAAAAEPPVKPMAHAALLQPWLAAFTEDDPANGGCARYKPPAAESDAVCPRRAALAPSP